ncbi:hypothetical protein L204_100128 [Cryptococcus depauperatus]
MTLLLNTVQPPLLTLLSSTSSPALSPLFVSYSDPSSSDTLITVLNDSEHNERSEEINRSNIVPRKFQQGFIIHPVIHIQSPNPRRAYIQAGCSTTSYNFCLRNGVKSQDCLPLGVALPCIGLQLRRLGQRDVSFEVGVVDSRKREGVIRCSSFKNKPAIYPHRLPPLICLPLTLPSSDSQLTPWLEIPINLASLLPLFQSLCRITDEEQEQDESRKRRRAQVELPSGEFESVSYVRIYANCRVRRIWFSAEGEQTFEGMGKGVKDEWALYAAEPRVSA